MRKRSSPWSEADARAVFVELAASGLSLSEFARREGIEEGRLYRWRRIVAETAPRNTSPPPSPPVIELRSSTRVAERVEIVLPSGVTLRVAETIDAAALARLIAAAR